MGEACKAEAEAAAELLRVRTECSVSGVDARDVEELCACMQYTTAPGWRRAAEALRAAGGDLDVACSHLAGITAGPDAGGASAAGSSGAQPPDGDDEASGASSESDGPDEAPPRRDRSVTFAPREVAILCECLNWDRDRGWRQAAEALREAGGDIDRAFNRLAGVPQGSDDDGAGAASSSSSTTSRSSSAPGPPLSTDHSRSLRAMFDGRKRRRRPGGGGLRTLPKYQGSS